MVEYVDLNNKISPRKNLWGRRNHLCCNNSEGRCAICGEIGVGHQREGCIRKKRIHNEKESWIIIMEFVIQGEKFMSRRGK